MASPAHRLIAFCLVAGLLACGDTSGPGGGTPPPPPPPPPPPGPPPPPSPQVTVNVRNNFFDPVVASVNAGGTVTWVWVGQNHNVTSVLNPAFQPNSATTNAPFQHGPLTFNTPGTYRYICTVHGSEGGGTTSGMAGTVVVQ